MKHNIKSSKVRNKIIKKVVISFLIGSAAISGYSFNAYADGSVANPYHNNPIPHHIPSHATHHNKTAKASKNEEYYDDLFINHGSNITTIVEPIDNSIIGQVPLLLDNHIDAKHAPISDFSLKSPQIPAALSVSTPPPPPFPGSSLFPPPPPPPPPIFGGPALPIPTKVVEGDKVIERLLGKFAPEGEKDAVSFKDKLENSTRKAPVRAAVAPSTESKQQKVKTEIFSGAGDLQKKLGVALALKKEKAPDTTSEGLHLSSLIDKPLTPEELKDLHAFKASAFTPVIEKSTPKEVIEKAKPVTAPATNHTLKAFYKDSDAFLKKIEASDELKALSPEGHKSALSNATNNLKSAKQTQSKIQELGDNIYNQVQQYERLDKAVKTQKLSEKDALEFKEVQKTLIANIQSSIKSLDALGSSDISSAVLQKIKGVEMKGDQWLLKAAAADGNLKALDEYIKTEEQRVAFLQDVVKLQDAVKSDPSKLIEVGKNLKDRSYPSLPEGTNTIVAKTLSSLSAIPEAADISGVKVVQKLSGVRGATDGSVSLLSGTGDLNSLEGFTNKLTETKNSVDTTVFGIQNTESTDKAGSVSLSLEEKKALETKQNQKNHTSFLSVVNREITKFTEQSKVNKSILGEKQKVEDALSTLKAEEIKTAKIREVSKALVAAADEYNKASVAIKTVQENPSLGFTLDENGIIESQHNNLKKAQDKAGELKELGININSQVLDAKSSDAMLTLLKSEAKIKGAFEAEEKIEHLQKQQELIKAVEKGEQKLQEFMDKVDLAGPMTPEQQQSVVHDFLKTVKEGSSIVSQDTVKELFPGLKTEATFQKAQPLASAIPPPPAYPSWFVDTSPQNNVVPSVPSTPPPPPPPAWFKAVPPSGASDSGVASFLSSDLISKTRTSLDQVKTGVGGEKVSQILGAVEKILLPESEGVYLNTNGIKKSSLAPYSSDIAKVVKSQESLKHSDSLEFKSTELSDKLQKRLSNLEQVVSADIKGASDLLQKIVSENPEMRSDPKIQELQNKIELHASSEAEKQDSKKITENATPQHSYNPLVAEKSLNELQPKMSDVISELQQGGVKLKKVETIEKNTLPTQEQIAAEQQAVTEPVKEFEALADGEFGELDWSIDEAPKPAASTGSISESGSAQQEVPSILEEPDYDGIDFSSDGEVVDMNGDKLAIVQDVEVEVVQQQAEIETVQTIEQPTMQQEIQSEITQVEETQQLPQQTQQQGSNQQQQQPQAEASQLAQAQQDPVLSQQELEQTDQQQEEIPEKVQNQENDIKDLRMHSEAFKVVTNAHRSAISSRADILLGQTNGIASGSEESIITKTGIWAKVSGGKASQGKDGSISAFDMSHMGVTGGVDFTFGENVIVGAAIGHDTMSISSGDVNEQSGELKTTSLSIYSSAKLTDSLTFGIQAGKGWLDGGENTKLDSKFASANLKYNMNFGDGFVLAPKVGLDFMNISDGAEIDDTTLSGTAGLSLSKRFKVSENFAITPEMHAGVGAVLNGKDKKTDITTALSDNPEKGMKHMFGASFKLEATDMLEFDAGYDYSGTKNFSSHNGYLQVKLKF